MSQYYDREDFYKLADVEKYLGYKLCKDRKQNVKVRKQKAYDRAEKNGSRAQYSDEELEQELKNEDNWIMDVYDAYYDLEDMRR